MADDEEDRPHGPADDEELTNQLARLNEEQQARYQTQVQNAIDRNVEASRQYRLKLAGILLKDMPDPAKNLEIRDLNRLQDQIAYRRDHERDEKDRAKQTTSPAQEPPVSERKDAPSPVASSGLDNPLQGKNPHAQPRDYSELQRTHDQIAQQSKQAGYQPAAPKPHEQVAASAIDVLSKETLALMIEHFPEIRREANLLTTRGEIKERDELTRKQEADRIKLEQAHGAQPTPWQHEERNLLDHQHLAEQAGVQAKWIARHLEAQGSPDAARYKNDTFRAFETARHLYGQSQKRAHSHEATPKVRDDQSQKQSDEQQALHGGKVLSSEQRANLTPEARHTTERKERAEAARETTGSSKNQTQQQGAGKGGPSRGGGRSR